ncbi:zinc finger protein [Fusarium austroafricanum]|uniref:Zinc finger protein n=1 Tax=Fusarium austroafricanum TaxID=2364996 RepID=A0A8H4P0T2_9HYPO|nr:zinc finger protein [Fusarium austroafricanum]
MVEKTVEWLLSLAFEKSDAPNLRIIFSSQRDGVSDVLLKSHPSISLETSAHAEDIRRYCVEFSKQIQQKFRLSQKEQDNILSKVVGMFLYARVVLNNLLNQVTLSDLNKEVHPDTFPRGIEDAYSRVVARVLVEGHPTRPHALKLLGLLISGQRLLRWREVQAFFCIDPIQGEAHYDNDRLRVSSKELCGSLVDTGRVLGEISMSEETIQIVHPTAQRYLIERHLIMTSLEHANMSLFCSQYLVSKPFSAGADRQAIMSYAKTGSYSFLDYAVQHWYDHAKFCINSIESLEPSLVDSVIKSLATFLNSYGHKVTNTHHHNTGHDREVINIFQSLAADGYQRSKHLRIELRTRLIRQQLEELYEKGFHSQQSVILDLYGPKQRLKCPKPWCSFFMGSFQTVEEREKHVRRHERPFYCPVEGCFASKLGFESASLLEQHQTSQHSKTTDELRFPTLKPKITKDLRSAAKSGNVEAVKSILNDATKYASPKIINTSLSLAAENGHAENMTPLEFAVRSGHLDVVSLLLAQPNINGWNIFYTACLIGRFDMARLIFETVGCEETEKHLIMAHSIQSGNLTLIQYLIENGFREYVPEILDIKGILENQDSGEILELLLNTGCPILEVSDVEYTIQAGYINEAKMLLSYKELHLSRGDKTKLIALARQQGSDGLIDLIQKVEPFDRYHWYSTEEALQQHIYDERTKPLEDPLKFAQANLALALGLEPDGTKKKES